MSSPFSSTNKDVKLINQNLITIYDKISKSSTLYVGIELFRLLIKESSSSSVKMNAIISNITDYTKKLKGVDKKEPLTLLPLIFQKKQNLPFLIKILSILSDSISLNTEHIFEYISNVFGEIVYELDHQGLLNDDVYIYIKTFIFEHLNINSFYIMSSPFDINKCYQICGFLFLSKLINNSNYIVESNSFITEVSNILISHLSYVCNKYYYAKFELLKCLEHFIMKIKNKFTPYVSESLKRLSQLRNNHLDKFEWNLKKIVLEILHNIVTYCKDGIGDGVGIILQIAKKCQGDKSKEVRISAMSLLGNLNELYGNVYDSNTMCIDLQRSTGSCGNKLKSSSAFRDKSYREQHKKNYNDKFEFVEKKIHSSSNDNNNNNNTINMNEYYSEPLLMSSSNNVNNNNTICQNDLDSKFNGIEKHMQKINQMQNDLIESVDHIQNHLTKTFTDFNERLLCLEQGITKLNTLSFNNKSIPHSKPHNSTLNYNDIITSNLSNDSALLSSLYPLDIVSLQNTSPHLIESVLSRFILLSQLTKDNELSAQYFDILSTIYANYSHHNIKPNTLIILQQLIKHTNN